MTILKSPTQPASNPPKVPTQNTTQTDAAMSKLSAKTCENAKPSTSGRDRLLGDGNGLFLRVRPHGTKTWIVEYEFRARRRKTTIGIFDSKGAPGESITVLLARTIIAHRNWRTNEHVT